MSQLSSPRCRNGFRKINLIFNILNQNHVYLFWAVLPLTYLEIPLICMIFPWEWESLPLDANKFPRNFLKTNNIRLILRNRSISIYKSTKKMLVFRKYFISCGNKKATYQHTPTRNLFGILKQKLAVNQNYLLYIIL